jgi:hypothetical protein
MVYVRTYSTTRHARPSILLSRRAVEPRPQKTWQLGNNLATSEKFAFRLGETWQLVEIVPISSAQLTCPSTKRPLPFAADDRGTNVYASDRSRASLPRLNLPPQNKPNAQAPQRRDLGLLPRVFLRCRSCLSHRLIPLSKVCELLFWRRQAAQKRSPLVFLRFQMSGNRLRHHLLHPAQHPPH